MTDFSPDSPRQLMAGMTYALPPTQDKVNPMRLTREEFSSLWQNAPAERGCDKFLVSSFSGISPVVAREVTYLATRHTDTPLKYCFEDEIFNIFSSVTERIKNEDFSPCIVYDGEKTVEYSFTPITQYGAFECRAIESTGQMLDAFFESRDNAQRVHQRASDILRLLTNAEARIRKKLELQRAELAECEKGIEFKRCGNLITANIYRLSRGMTEAEFDDYENMRDDGTFEQVRVDLDSRLSPAANAQRYYKKYNKSKTAKVELAKQIALGETELSYIYTVFEALTRAENPTDLSEIRDELYRSGYASRMKVYSAHKEHKPIVMQFKTPDGMTVLCGKNNLQNEYITHKIAQKTDYWFHAKQTAGSHVLLVTEGREPTDLDFTTAAEIAAFYSKAEGDNVAVDYTLAKNVKKSAGAKPGFVIYHTNWTAYVTPNADKIAGLRIK